MADDIYIEILKMKAGKPPKVHKDYAKTGPVMMKKYAEKYIKKAKGYTPKKTGTSVVMTGPSNMKPLARITRGAGVPDPSKGGVDACIDAVMAALVKDAIKTLKKMK